MLEELDITKEEYESALKISDDQAFNFMPNAQLNVALKTITFMKAYLHGEQILVSISLSNIKAITWICRKKINVHKQLNRLLTNLFKMKQTITNK